MKKLTGRTITDEEILAFRDGAASAGDLEAVALCDLALARRGGRWRIAEWINHARGEGYDPDYPPSIGHVFT
jgi:hypothetical protein